MGCVGEPSDDAAGPVRASLTAASWRRRPGLTLEYHVLNALLALLLRFQIGEEALVRRRLPQKPSADFAQLVHLVLR